MALKNEPASGHTLKNLLYFKRLDQICSHLREDSSSKFSGTCWSKFHWRFIRVVDLLPTSPFFFELAQQLLRISWESKGPTHPQCQHLPENKADYWEIINHHCSLTSANKALFPRWKPWHGFIASLDSPWWYFGLPSSLRIVVGFRGNLR